MCPWYTPPQQDRRGPILTIPMARSPILRGAAMIAGVCNASGHIFGLMPHPERYVSPLQHPLRKANADGEGDGLLIFKNAYTYAQKLHISNRRVQQAAYTASGVDI